MVGKGVDHGLYEWMCVSFYVSYYCFAWQCQQSLDSISVFCCISDDLDTVVIVAAANFGFNFGRLSRSVDIVGDVSKEGISFRIFEAICFINNFSGFCGAFVKSSAVDTLNEKQNNENLKNLTSELAEHVPEIDAS